MFEGKGKGGCHKCISGWVTIPDEGVGTAIPCDCRSRDSQGYQKRLMDGYGVPKRYLGKTLDNWEGTVPMDAQAFLSNPIREWALYLYGDGGRGKTHLATGIFRKLVGQGMSGRWIDSGVFIDSLRDFSRSGDNSSYRRRMNLAKNARILLIDDYHRVRTDYAIEVMDELVRHRHAQELPLMITSNLSLGELIEAPTAGERMRDPTIMSRLKEGLQLKLGGQDWR